MNDEQQLEMRDIDLALVSKSALWDFRMCQHSSRTRIAAKYCFLGDLNAITGEISLKISMFIKIITLLAQEKNETLILLNQHKLLKCLSLDKKKLHEISISPDKKSIEQKLNEIKKLDKIKKPIVDMMRSINKSNEDKENFNEIKRAFNVIKQLIDENKNLDEIKKLEMLTTLIFLNGKRLDDEKSIDEIIKLFKKSIDEIKALDEIKNSISEDKLDKIKKSLDEVKEFDEIKDSIDKQADSIAKVKEVDEISKVISDKILDNIKKSIDNIKWDDILSRGAEIAKVNELKKLIKELIDEKKNFDRKFESSSNLIDEIKSDDQKLIANIKKSYEIQKSFYEQNFNKKFNIINELLDQIKDVNEIKKAIDYMKELDEKKKKLKEN
jgi:hypothetical protein